MSLKDCGNHLDILKEIKTTGGSMKKRIKHVIKIILHTKNGNSRQLSKGSFTTFLNDSSSGLNTTFLSSPLQVSTPQENEDILYLKAWILQPKDGITVSSKPTKIARPGCTSLSHHTTEWRGDGESCSYVRAMKFQRPPLSTQELHTSKQESDFKKKTLTRSTAPVF